MDNRILTIDEADWLRSIGQGGTRPVLNQEGYVVRLTMIGAAVGLMVLAGCDGSTEPAQPPTQEDALTTATVAPPTPSDEVDVTTEAAPTTAEPTTAEPTQEDDAGGPPQLPEEATEQTEEGAEAFALHYLEMVNYTGQHPEEGLLEPLAGEDCQTCANYEENVASLLDNDAANDGEAAEVGEARGSRVGDSFVVYVDLSQNDYRAVTGDGTVIEEYDRISDVEFRFTLSPAEPFVVDEIQVSAS